jgi:hypothetical protein
MAPYGASQKSKLCVGLAIPPRIDQHQGEIWQGGNAESAVS